MKKIYTQLILSARHLSALNDTFLEKDNYSNSNDFLLYQQNYREVSRISSELGLPEQLYSMESRQMKLADILEYIFFSRGIFTLINGSNQLIKLNIPSFRHSGGGPVGARQ